MRKLTYSAIAFVGTLTASLTAHADGSASSTLYEGEYLFAGQRLVSDSCYYHLEMQSSDGNFVLYAGEGTGTPIWDTGPDCIWGSNGMPTLCFANPADYVTLQGDGNFVLYNSLGESRWSVKTAGGDDATTAEIWLQNDGNIVEYRGTPPGDQWSNWNAQTVHGDFGQSACDMQTSKTYLEPGTNLPGGDYEYSTTNDYFQCAGWCAASAWAPAGEACNAFTWVPPEVQGPTGVCWLKSTIPGSPTAVSGMVSGVIRH
jgi:hypothetical protein